MMAVPSHFPAPLRYYPLSAQLRREFGCRVHRVALDAGFSCPNADGVLGRGGCVFCEEGSRAAYVDPALPVPDQVRRGIERMRRRFRAEKFLVYFQANSNTHAAPERLREIFDSALVDKAVVGLAVGTRADCLAEDVLDLLEEYHQRMPVWLELGLQSANENSLRWMNRGHELAVFVDGSRRAAARGLRLCGHLLLGLPGETRDDALRSAELLASLGYQGLKLHMLYVSRRARLAAIYEDEPFPLLEREAYVSLACDVLERLPPELALHRLVSECREEDLIAPQWLRDKGATLDALNADLVRRDTWQGRRFSKDASPIHG